MLNQYFRNYVKANQKDWGEHLHLVEFCYNFITRSDKNVLVWINVGQRNQEALMDLAIPMRQTNHSKEVVEMVKGREELYAQTKKLLEQVMWKTFQ